MGLPVYPITLENTIDYLYLYCYNSEKLVIVALCLIVVIIQNV